MNTYNVLKSYTNKPSKNKIEEKNVTIDVAEQSLNISEHLWRKHGGTIISRSPTELVCEESDSSEIVTWQIINTEQ